mmetsp:Transcript_79844/g.226390  ORF Transcript_79844/g.226390 Transcript_79844/m.226390 type:complete len:211 (+) Transcript_79844:1242-1874(+)
MNFTKVSPSRSSFTSHPWDLSMNSDASLKRPWAYMSFFLMCSMNISLSSRSCHSGVPSSMPSFGSTPLPGSLFRARSFWSARCLSRNSLAYARQAYGDSSSFTSVRFCRSESKATRGSFGPPASGPFSNGEVIPALAAGSADHLCRRAVAPPQARQARGSDTCAAAGSAQPPAREEEGGGGGTQSPRPRRSHSSTCRASTTRCSGLPPSV